MTEEKGKVILVDISGEMKDAYLNYAMSVIVGRALPDIRDGLKPVQRRILYAMHEMNLRFGEPYRKSARVVGDVLGKYHPHGDMAVYEALVRMAQDFTYRYPLVDGHGNFGSVDGDPPAAMRYTEVRMAAIASEMLQDLEKETVEFIPNFDESAKEPVVLPAAFPQLLANGASGIAVGMATNIPPHNLGELIDGILFLIDHPEADYRELLRFIPGPDFSTGGKIVGRRGIEDYFREGKGKFTLQGEAYFEEIGKGKQALIIRELPYQVNKAQLVEHIAHLIEEKKLPEVVEVRDESDRDGVRVVLELRRGANPRYVMNYLLKHTAFRVSFGVILLALVEGKPEILGMKEALTHFIEHRKTVVRRRSTFELREAEEKIHILEGFLKALDHIDAVIATIRASQSVPEAKEALVKRFSFTEKQAQAILEMRLQRLVALEREKIAAEYEELKEKVARLREILSREEVLLGVVKEELEAIRAKYADSRRTKIVDEEGEVEEEELIREEDIVITLTRDGYVKRVPLLTYRRQGRGGKGITGITTKEEDLVSDITVTTTLSRVLLFTSSGRVFQLPAHRIPEAPRQGKGMHLANLIPLEGEERVVTLIPVRNFEEGKYLFFVTRRGKVKKSDLLEFMSITRKGIRAITLEEGDTLSAVFITQGESEVFLATALGYGLLFSEKDVRPMGRSAGGVRGMNLREGDRVVGACLLNRKETLLVVSSLGLGKRMEMADFPRHRRGGRGIIIMRTGKKGGPLVGIVSAEGNEEVLVSTRSGLLIRLHLSEIPVQGRMTQGVRLIRLEKDDEIADVALVK
ncbi:MAG: DNA gyrase subunit A [Candidatus Atribacteria bacterium]|nr:DNA gyrase subunit A [Candidatus Atribacteria bacterium]